MSRIQGRRASRIAVVAFLLTILTVNAPFSSPASPESRPEPPDLERVLVLEELAEWVRTGRPPVVSPLMEDQDLTQAVRFRRRSFDLFRGYAAAEDRRALLRRLPYGDLLSRAAERYELDGLLLAAVAEAESSFDPEAVSSQGALGLMQVMPETAELFSVFEPAEPSVNVDVGARYLAWLLERFDGDLELALAAYNAGPGNVDRFGGVPPFKETRSYVNRVLGHYVEHHREVWRTSGADQLVF